MGFNPVNRDHLLRAIQLGSTNGEENRACLPRQVRNVRREGFVRSTSKHASTEMRPANGTYGKELTADRKSVV